jgi:hypothetical protein
MPIVNRPEKLLSWLLRSIGVLDLAALTAVFMPASWHEHLHAGVGLGALPHSPVVLYLARSASALYAVYGALLLFLSFDVVRYLPVIRFLVRLAFLHAALLVGIDINAGLPGWWAVAEGAGYAGWAGAAAWLASNVDRA